MTVETFFDEYWEQKPLLIRRPGAGRAHWTTEWESSSDDAASSSSSSSSASAMPTAAAAAAAAPLSSAQMRQWMREGVLTHEHDITVTRYDLEQRKRVNLDEEAVGPVALDAMEARLAEGCSVRLLCPHAHSRALWRLLETLQSAFGTFVGSNAYWTPCNSQGFAPHYDDIEAFILQFEGRKRWFVYPPPSASETLPRFSSNDFNRAYRGSAEAAAAVGAKPGVTPLIDTILEPGDLLYFPRGFVHHAEALDSGAASASASAAPSVPSLHLTISTALRNTWRDLVEIMVRAALETAADGDDIALRASLPPSFAEHLGIAASDRDDGPRRALRAAAAEKLQRVVDVLRAPQLLDAAADEMTRQNLKGRLPPCPPARHWAQHGIRRAATELPSWAATPSGGGEAAEAEAEVDGGSLLPPPPLELRPAERWWNESSSSSSSSSSQKEEEEEDLEYRLVRHDVMSFSMDPSGEEALVVSHCAANSLRYHEAPEECGIERFPLEAGEFLEHLLRAYPEWSEAAAFEGGAEVVRRLAACGVLSSRKTRLLQLSQHAPQHASLKRKQEPQKQRQGKKKKKKKQKSKRKERDMSAFFG